VFKRISFVLLSTGLGLLTLPTPTLAQALLPYTIKQDPKSLEETSKSLLRQAAGLVQFQQYEQAIPRLALATQLAPKNHETWYFLGTLYVQTQKYDKAIAALQKSRSLKPNDPDVLFMLGSAYFQNGNNQPAIDALQAGLKIKPESQSPLFDLGNAYYKSNRHQDAIATYQKIVAKDAKFWPAINNMGLISYEKGDINGALQLWNRCLSIDPKAAEPMMAKAVAFFVQGKGAEAISTLSAAMKIDSRYASIKHLQDNLWGNKLINDTRRFIQTPQARDVITKGK
jgi:cytochrome c-type biogenesis protein CcmH/NrfG